MPRKSVVAIEIALVNNEGIPCMALNIINCSEESPSHPVEVSIISSSSKPLSHCIVQDLRVPQQEAAIKTGCCKHDLNMYAIGGKVAAHG